MYPHYFEYHIERGVEWIRIYTPGPWQPVATATLGRAPDYASTYREWRKSYHFDVYLPADSTGGTAADPNVMPISYVSYHGGSTETGTHEVINALAFHYQPLDRRSS